MIKKLLLTSMGIVAGLAAMVFFLDLKIKTQQLSSSTDSPSLATATGLPVATSIPTQPSLPTPTLLIPPSSKILQSDYHVFQTFNNCGPASLSMALSYYGIRVPQQELRDAMRPYNNVQGDNDDKSVTLDEIAAKGAEYGFVSFHRPNGNVELVKQFIANDIPVITETLLHSDDDIGHYRVIKGYDETTQEFIQDDSMQGKNLRYKYGDFNQLWQIYNYGYVVLVPKEKLAVAQAILGEDLDEKIAWKKIVDNAQVKLQQNPNDFVTRFNLSIGLYKIAEYQKSVDEFEKVEKQLPFRTLWYQIEPLLSYYQLGNDQRVLQLIDQILSNHNRAFSELYILRGDVYKRQGNLKAAKTEYEQAVFYNKNLKAAQDALNSI